MIETYLLENLVAFGDYGTLSEAAEKLHVSQPSLTRSMQKLEDEIGVPLFERTKNRISLNEFGLQAVSSARWILQEQDNMVRELQSRYRLSRTISLGCCAPVPSWDMQQTLSQLYPDLTISVEIRPEEILWRGLSEEIYQLIVVPVQTSIYQEDGIRFPELQGTPADRLQAVPYRRERLSVSLPAAHPLAREKELSFKDIDGLTMLQYRSVGFWFPICQEKMPHSRFLMQDDYATFREIVSSSSIPCFSTDLMRARTTVPDTRLDSRQRINIPLTDPEIDITYVLVLKKENRARFQALLKQIIHE